MYRKSDKSHDLSSVVYEAPTEYKQGYITTRLYRDGPVITLFTHFNYSYLAELVSSTLNFYSISFDFQFFEEIFATRLRNVLLRFFRIDLY